MAKITTSKAILSNSENEWEAGIEKLIYEAQSGSADVLKNIVLLASGLIDNTGKIGEESLERICSGLAQIDKNVSASGDVIRGVNLFVETSLKTDESSAKSARQ